MNCWFSWYDIRAFNTYGRQPKKKLQAKKTNGNSTQDVL